MIFLLKLVKRRKHGIKCLFVYPVTEHIHDDCFKFAVKAVKQVVYRLSCGFGICILLLRIRIEISGLEIHKPVRAVIAMLIAFTAGDRITEVNSSGNKPLFQRSNADFSTSAVIFFALIDMSMVFFAPFS